MRSPNSSWKKTADAYPAARSMPAAGLYAAYPPPPSPTYGWRPGLRWPLWASHEGLPWSSGRTRATLAPFPSFQAPPWPQARSEPPQSGCAVAPPLETRLAPASRAFHTGRCSGTRNKGGRSTRQCIFFTERYAQAQRKALGVEQGFDRVPPEGLNAERTSVSPARASLSASATRHSRENRTIVQRKFKKTPLSPATWQPSTWHTKAQLTWERSCRCCRSWSAVHMFPW